MANLIEHRFGKERAALYEVEIEHLVEKGYTHEEINTFLETYASSIGIFDLLSMFMRSKMNVKDLEKSLLFLFNRHISIMETLSSCLKSHDRILDVGCGRGLITCSLALKGFEVHGVDVSGDAVEIAKKLAQKLRCESTFSLIDEKGLPFPDEYFDAALCVWTLHEISQDRIPELFAELYRTLRKTGNVFVIDQEGVTSIEVIKRLMSESGFRLDLEKNLLPVYDHGKTSQALMLKYVKEQR